MSQSARLPPMWPMVVSTHLRAVFLLILQFSPLNESKHLTWFGLAFYFILGPHFCCSWLFVFIVSSCINPQNCWWSRRWRHRSGSHQPKPAPLPPVVHNRSTSLSTSSRKDPRGHVFRTLGSGSGHRGDQPHTGKDSHGRVYRGRGSDRWADGRFASTTGGHVSHYVCANSDRWIHWKVRHNFTF